jgi:cell division septation protein DedD
MATGSKGGDMVLGGRHLAGMFVVLVVLFGVVFTLGYVLGRNHGEAQPVAAAAVPGKPVDVAVEKKPAASAKSSSEPALPQPNTDWDFYHAAEPTSPSERLVTAAPKPVSVEKNAAPSLAATRRPAAKGETANSRSLNGPLIARGSTVLQVAALARQGDALALAQALQQKKFPVFVLNPTSDHYYRVQVGPFGNSQAATAAQKRLESQGFKSIVKR